MARIEIEGIEVSENTPEEIKEAFSNLGMRVVTSIEDRDIPFPVGKYADGLVKKSNHECCKKKVMVTTEGKKISFRDLERAFVASTCLPLKEFMERENTLKRCNLSEAEYHSIARDMQKRFSEMMRSFTCFRECSCPELEQESEEVSEPLGANWDRDSAGRLYQGVSDEARSVLNQLARNECGISVDQINVRALDGVFLDISNKAKELGMETPIRRSRPDPDSAWKWPIWALHKTFKAALLSFLTRIEGLTGKLDTLTPPEYYGCFPAGTLVRTIKGDVPIEEIRPGTLVLTSLNRWRAVKDISSTDSEDDSRKDTSEEKGEATLPDGSSTSSSENWDKDLVEKLYQSMSYGARSVLYMLAGSKQEAATKELCKLLGIGIEGLDDTFSEISNKAKALGMVSPIRDKNTKPTSWEHSTWTLNENFGGLLRKHLNYLLVKYAK